VTAAGGRAAAQFHSIRIIQLAVGKAIAAVESPFSVKSLVVEGMTEHVLVGAPPVVDAVGVAPHPDAGLPFFFRSQLSR
jgi:hypothetical protein